MLFFDLSPESLRQFTKAINLEMLSDKFCFHLHYVNQKHTFNFTEITPDSHQKEDDQIFAA